MYVRQVSYLTQVLRHEGTHREATLPIRKDERALNNICKRERYEKRVFMRQGGLRRRRGLKGLGGGQIMGLLVPQAWSVVPKGAVNTTTIIPSEFLG